MLIPSKWLNDNTPYKPEQAKEVFQTVFNKCEYIGEGRTKYLNIPLSFDTETTSFYDNYNRKSAIMFCWMFGVYGLVIMGRTWEEWLIVYNEFIKFFRIYGNKRQCICYVHNLSFDFEFLRKYHRWEKVFALENHSPLYARTIDGFEFRCSYLLSGYKLEKVAENLKQYKIKKLMGDLDYRILRHSQTVLTEKEIGYCLNDVKIVNAYISEIALREGDITKIPLTKTGFVRNYCRKECFNDNNYHYLIRQLTLTPDEFTLCKDGFQGGYVHSNPDKVNELLYNCVSSDIASSYPCTMIAEKFPMSNPKHVKITKYSELKEYCKNYCCVFSIQLNKIHPRYWYDFYISASKCEIHGKRQLSNGRIVFADSIITTITNVDFDIIDYMYCFDKNKISIGDFIYFERDYLPTAFVKSILTLYQKKTELKGVKGKEIEYAVIKENQNSCYGMTVTSPVRDEIIYFDDEWKDPITPDLNNAIAKYNKSYNRFLYYPWGIFVTAYARHNVWEAIIECKDDYIYCDTDSVKCINYDKHKSFFEQYNERMYKKLCYACKIHGLPIEMITPKNKYGEIKMLGAFEIDGIYDKFKTLGAKRYMYQIKNEYGLTVAGLNKEGGIKYLSKQYKNPFDGFNENLNVPARYSGRLIHTYIDSIREGDLIDVNGLKCHYKELSGIHLEPGTYKISDIQSFLNFVQGIKEGDYDVNY